METTSSSGLDPAAERLASEFADVRASIALVRSGVASNITLTGLRFSQQLADSLGRAAAAEGIHLEASFWPEDDHGDLHVSRAGGVTGDRDGRPAGPGSAGEAGGAREDGLDG